MLLFRNASRTERAGELYEKYLFSRVKDGNEAKPRWVNELAIAPAGETDFNPKRHNWRRRAKVPILVLNAGHNWQFTATWMGEPPAGIDNEIDGNYRLRRMYYEAPEAYRQYRLGHAVAASSCVPGLFEPINMPDLFAGRTIRLVDGVCMITRDRFLVGAGMCTPPGQRRLRSNGSSKRTRQQRTRRPDAFQFRIAVARARSQIP